MEYDLVVIPVINKIDLPNANVPALIQELQSVFDFNEDEILLTSGKTGEPQRSWWPWLESCTTLDPESGSKDEKRNKTLRNRTPDSSPAGEGRTGPYPRSLSWRR